MSRKQFLPELHPKTAPGYVVGKRVLTTLTGILVLRPARGGAWVGGQHWGKNLSVDQARVRFPPDGVALLYTSATILLGPILFGHLWQNEGLQLLSDSLI
jgi:hypothetical protein